MGRISFRERRGGELALAPEPVQRAERGLGARLRRAVGMRHTFSVGGVKYRELSTESLRQALSRSGSGKKEYEVTFASGESMRIAATPQRVFADLVGPRLVGVYGRVEEGLRPGMRVLLLEAGTGFEAAWVGGRVAPSGAVVALDRDEAAVAYAQRRYASPIISFEVGGVEAIAGETRGAFDAVCAVGALRQAGDHVAVLRELWRLLGPAGLLVVACPTASGRRGEAAVDRLASAKGEMLSLDAEALVTMVRHGTGPVRAVGNAYELNESDGSGKAEGSKLGGGSSREAAAVDVSALGGEADGWSVVVAVKPDDAVG
jgi:SAM-dependent methyltransferase